MQHATAGVESNMPLTDPCQLDMLLGGNWRWSGARIRQAGRSGARITLTYDGFLAEFRGDGILAYFGYPLAHEDDAERTCGRGSISLPLLPDLRRAPRNRSQFALASRPAW